jgi:hypothetical protein
MNAKNFLAENDLISITVRPKDSSLPFLSPLIFDGK